MCGAQLRNFKRKSNGTFNCSCPVCGDSQKKLSKARGYFLLKNNSYFYCCHNCQVKMSLSYFLKTMFPLYYQEYVLEKYKDKNCEIKLEEVKNTPVVLKVMSTKNAQSIDVLPDAHYAKQYIKARMVPEDKFSLLYYTSDFAKLTEELFPSQYDNLKSDDARIVIPFFDNEGRVIGLQGRSLDGDNSLRYVTVRASKDTNLIYGTERLDLSKKVLVVEGPIDSLFLPNCVAVASSDLERSLKVVPNIKDYILVFDNEPRNKEIVSLISDAVENGRTVCVWSKEFQEKDINDMVRAGHRKEDIYKAIVQNSYSGLRAKLKLNEWRKC